MCVLKELFCIYGDKDPRVKFCWWCGNKLRSKKGGGYHYVEIIYRERARILHRQCEEIVEKENLLS